MIILGLQFGHDGGVSIIKDGKILSYIYRERFSRVKHAIGISDNEIGLAFSQAGITVADIDYVAIVSTQNIELLVGALTDFSIQFAMHPNHKCPNVLVDIYEGGKQDIGQLLSYKLKELFGAPDQHKDSLPFRVYSDTCIEKDSIANGTIASTGWLDNYIDTESWQKNRRLGDIPTQNIQPYFSKDSVQYGFHYPVTVTFQGKDIAGYYINHHIAHAASCYYRSGFNDAAIITHDGFGAGVGYHSGLLLYGQGNKITPLSPHHLALGSLYDRVGVTLKLGSVGPAGKLMGLAPYGKPAFFQNNWIGNWYDWLATWPGKNPFNVWLEQCLALAQAMGYDMKLFADSSHITAPVNADIAASTQKLFEECYMATVRALHMLLLRNNIYTPNLCMSGGTALNCPNNSYVYNEGPFPYLYIEPNCGDDGLAIGSALYVYYHLYEHALDNGFIKEYQYPYAGPLYTEKDILAAFESYKGKITFEKCSDAAAQAAQAVQDNKVIAWFEGQGEFGPRALGHRSIVSNPTYADNWERVNRVKGRERWRPFAPSVLEEEANNWFRHLPAISPYMLFTGQVASTQLPAITHVDGSSRIQTVNASNGEYYRLIKEFYRLSGIPVVMNTSFNGPGEPVIETPAEAVAFLVSTEIDALYMAGYCVSRARLNVS